MGRSIASVGNLTRLPIPLVMLVVCLTACQQRQAPDNRTETSPPAASVQSFAGAGRDRLCFDPNSRRMGLVTYASGDRNCALRGTLGQAGDLRPDGDQHCQVQVALKGDRIVLLDAIPPECAYYCAAPATFAGKTFVRMAKPQPVTDIAGDPLC